MYLYEILNHSLAPGQTLKNMQNLSLGGVEYTTRPTALATKEKGGFQFNALQYIASVKPQLFKTLCNGTFRPKIGSDKVFVV